MDSDVPQDDEQIGHEEELRQQPFVVPFPNPSVGAPIPARVLSRYEEYQDTLVDAANPWTPFNSRIDWEVARWAKMQGPGSTAVSDLLKIDGVRILLV